MKVVVNDRLSGTAANVETAFAVVATPASLLAEAPPPGAAFKRASVLAPGTFAETVAAGADAPADGEWVRISAATRIANRREADAIALLDSYLAISPGDQDAQFLLLHALYAQFVHQGKPLDRPSSEQFTRLAEAYIHAKGAHATLAADWLKVISSSASTAAAPAAFLPF